MKAKGWHEGQGLGKHSDGIIEPIQASMKNNRRGVGYHLKTT
jgi:hypothetical protein